MMASHSTGVLPSAPMLSNFPVHFLFFVPFCLYGCEKNKDVQRTKGRCHLARQEIDTKESVLYDALRGTNT